MKQPDLILLHGALGSGDQFTPLLPLLEGIGKVHTIDFEGHGRAIPKNRPFEVDYFVENILDYMAENGLAVVDLFGYSMGGCVALCLARRYPERVGRIFTFATKFQWNPETAEKEASYLDPDRIEKKAPKFAQALGKRHPSSGWRNILLKTKEMTLQQGRESVLTETDLKKIFRPVRLSMGDRDQMVSIEETINTYRLLPDAQLQIFPDTPHIIEQVSMEMLADAIFSFVLS
jgi:pimeloyl-ACP methyl ester carboxylesterase